MMNHEVTSAVGKSKSRRRAGRGRASGHGKTVGRGHKGQRSRAGARQHATYEGGQMPLFRRLPKRGFNNANFARRYTVVNVSQLEQFEKGTRVDPPLLQQAGLISRQDEKVKVLGNGELNHSLTVAAHKFSRCAFQKITSAGGTVENMTETAQARNSASS